MLIFDKRNKPLKKKTMEKLNVVFVLETNDNGRTYIWYRTQTIEVRKDYDESDIREIGERIVEEMGGDEGDVTHSLHTFMVNVSEEAFEVINLLLSL